MTDNPYTMTRAQRAQLVERLLPLYRERFDLRNKHVAWAELPGKSPELSEYSPEVLRFYTRACAHFGLLQDFEEQGDGFVKVCFAQQSALFAGPPEPQKDEFHMYDAGQMCLTFLDSVARTLQANFPGKDGRALDVYYLPESGDGDLVLESIGLAIPQNTPYKAA